MLATPFRHFLRTGRLSARGCAVASSALFALGLCSLSAPRARAQANVVTYHYNNRRNGLNPSETTLTPANVKPATFGKLYSRKVDGAIYSQPLVVSHLLITDSYTGQVAYRNVVFVCTNHNQIYAFDVDSGAGQFQRPYWQIDYNYPGLEISPVPAEAIGDISQPGSDIPSQIGIIGTPVIDTGTDTMFVLVRTQELNDYYQRLHAIDITTGREKPGSPYLISATVPGTGDASDTTGLPFDPLMQYQQAGLLFDHGVLYIAWGGHYNLDPFHGWIMAYTYDGTTFTQVKALSTTPDGSRGGILETGSGLAADPAGFLYTATGNGTFDANTGGNDYGQSVIKINRSYAISSYFSPYDQAQLSADQNDIGTGGTLVLPDYPGATAASASKPRLLVQTGLNGTIYLLNRDSLGGFNVTDNSNAVQTVEGQLGGVYGAPAYFNNRLYYTPIGDVIKSFTINNATLSSTPDAQGTSTRTFEFPSPVPVVSANGGINGIVWAVEAFYPPASAPNQAQKPPYSVLHAYDANNVATELYNSLMAGGRDLGGPVVPFAVPTVADGKVFVGGDGQMDVYGPLANKPTTAARFMVTGPVFCFGAGLFTSPTANYGYYYQIKAFGPDEQPIKLTNTLKIGLQSGGPIFYVGTQKFNNESTVVTNRYIRQTGFWNWYITDNAGQNKVNPTSQFINYANNTFGIDRFRLRAPSTARVGQSIPLTIRAVSINDSPVPLGDTFAPFPVIVYNTNVDGSQDEVPSDDFITIRSDFAYDDQFGMLYNFLGASAPTQPAQFTGQSEIIVRVTFKRPGPTIVIATDPNGSFVGTALVNVK